MEAGTTIFIIAILIIAIWIFVELKRMRHKIFALVLIGLILFLYFSVSAVFKEKEIDLTNMAGIGKAANIYFSWLGGIFGNLKSITTNAVNMNWQGNSTAIK